MDRDYVKGIKFGFGIVSTILLTCLLLFGLVYAVGFHPPSEIIQGAFVGNYSFDGNVNFTNASVDGIESIIPGMIITFNESSCPTDWTYSSLTPSIYSSDLTGSGTEIYSFLRSGDEPVQAFDDNYGNGWTSALSCNNEYIGYDFGVAIEENIGIVMINQGEHSQPGNAIYMLTSIKVQYSDDNSTWNDVGTYSILETDNLNQNISLDYGGTHRYWRVLANEACGSHWSVREIEFIGRETISCVK